MPDLLFTDRRLAGAYDALFGARPDLLAYAAIAEELGARSLVDIGCGTGSLACLLARRGLAVTALDPAEASLELARGKPGAERVRWVLGVPADLPPLEVDVAMMTGNVAQVFLTDEEWTTTLRAALATLRRGGRLVFETRNPEAKAWLEWSPERSERRTIAPGVGAFRTWLELLEVQGEFVSFRSTFVFEADGAVMMSESTLRFRERDALVRSLEAAGFSVDEVRDAPDRPGREMVFIARRP